MPGVCPPFEAFAYPTAFLGCMGGDSFSFCLLLCGGFLSHSKKFSSRPRGADEIRSIIPREKSAPEYRDCCDLTARCRCVQTDMSNTTGPGFIYDFPSGAFGGFLPARRLSTFCLLFGFPCPVNVHFCLVLLGAPRGIAWGDTPAAM